MLGAVRGAGREEQGRGNEGTGAQYVGGWEGQPGQGDSPPANRHWLCGAGAAVQ